MKTSTEFIANYPSVQRAVLVISENGSLTWRNACFLTLQLFPSQRLCLNILFFCVGSLMPIHWLCSLLKRLCCGDLSGAGQNWQMLLMKQQVFMSQPLCFPWKQIRAGRQHVPSVLIMQADTTQNQKACSVSFCSPNKTSFFICRIVSAHSPNAFTIQPMALT